MDFSDQQVFTGATTYTAIHVFGGSMKQTSVDYAKVSRLDDGRTQCLETDLGNPVAGVDRFNAWQPEPDSPWVFANDAVNEWLNSVRSTHPTLGEVADKIAQGIVTSDDEVYFLRNEDGRYRSDATGQTYDLERDVVHPLLKGSVHMKKWAVEVPERAVLFPYEEENGRWRLIPADKLQSRYPYAWAYLLANRTRLESRESGKMANVAGWYGYVYPKNLDLMSQRKVLVPAIATKAEYCLDLQGDYHYVGSGGGGGGGHAIVSSKIDLTLLCGLLNSKLLDTFLQRVTTPFHSGWFAYSKAYIAQIPIKLPETAAENALADRIADSVRIIMAAKAALRVAGLSDRERSQYERTVETHEKRIDADVFALYGVDGLPADA